MFVFVFFFFFNDTATTEIYTLSLHDALPIFVVSTVLSRPLAEAVEASFYLFGYRRDRRSEEHTSELQSRLHLVCRLLLEKKKRPPSRAYRACQCGISPCLRAGPRCAVAHVEI